MATPSLELSCLRWPLWMWMFLTASIGNPSAEGIYSAETCCWPQDADRVLVYGRGTVNDNRWIYRASEGKHSRDNPACLITQPSRHHSYIIHLINGWSVDCGDDHFWLSWRMSLWFEYEVVLLKQPHLDLHDWEVPCSASDREGSNFESCVLMGVSSHSYHHPQEVLWATISSGLKVNSLT